MNTLICPFPTFQRLLCALAADRRRSVLARVGLHSALPNREWLVRDFILSSSDTPVPQQEPVFRVALASSPPSLPSLDPLPPPMVGSLRTLNQLAAALSVQMIQDLVAERLRTSTWAQAEFDEAGHLHVQYPPLLPPADSPPCALCAKAGLGDGGLAWG